MKIMRIDEAGQIAGTLHDAPLRSNSIYRDPKRPLRDTAALILVDETGTSNHFGIAISPNDWAVLATGLEVQWATQVLGEDEARAYAKTVQKLRDAMLADRS